MKRLLFLISMLITCVSYINADEIVVPDIVIPHGGTATLDIQLNNEQQIRTEVQFLITLPEGISLVHNSSKIGERFVGMAVAPGDTPEGNNKWTVMISAAGATDAPIPGNSGTLVKVDLLADEIIEEGTELNGSLEITDMNLISGGTILGELQSVVNFKITIGEPADTRIVLDETSTTPPSAATGVDVRVKRTIKANEWSTICLPFAMSEAQVKAAFGNDVLLGDFNGYETTKDDGDNIIGITVKFNSATAIEANHPYIIKVSTAVTEFTVDGVDIDPEETPTKAAVKRTKKQWSEMIGTYVANTPVGDADEEAWCLFLSGNKFWYSMGQTKMKAFRAYFDFYDVLSSVENASAPVFITFNNDVTAIRNIEQRTDDARYYNLNGLHVTNVKRGLYIKNGKKLVVK